MKIFAMATITTTKVSGWMLAGVLTTTLLGVGYAWATQTQEAAAFVPSKDFTPATEKDETTASVASAYVVEDVDDMEEEQDVKEEEVEAEEEEEELVEDVEEEEEKAEEEEAKEEKLPASASAPATPVVALDDANLALAVEVMRLSSSAVMALGRLLEEAEEPAEEDEEDSEKQRQRQRQLEVEAEGTPKVDTETKAASKNESEPSTTTPTDATEETEMEEAEEEEEDDDDDSAPLVERRVVVFRPLTAVDHDPSSLAPTMAVSARFSETVCAIQDLYMHVTALTVAEYYEHLTDKYEAVADAFYENATASGSPNAASVIGKKQYPYVIVEDYQTGDNCVFVPLSQLNEIVGLDAMVRKRYMTRAQVPLHLRVREVFRGVRQRGRKVGAWFLPTPLEPLDPEMLCLVRDVPFSAAAAAAEAAIVKTEVAQFEERLLAQEYAKQMRELEEWRRKKAEKVKAENERKRDMALMAKEDTLSQQLRAATPECAEIAAVEDAEKEAPKETKN